MPGSEKKTKLDLLAEMAAKDAKAPFPRYGLAMELASLERLEEASEAFRALVRDLPDYGPTYFQAGKVLERLGRLDEARELYRRGAAVAARAGNHHAREELEAALALLE